MISIYDRIYYTLYRILLKLGDMFEMKRETPRSEAVLMLSLLTMLNVVPVLFLISYLTNTPFFSGKKIYIMIALLPIVILNFLLIFYRNRYRIIEERLAPKWAEEKRRNILITIMYIVFTFIFIWVSLILIKGKG